MLTPSLSRTSGSHYVFPSDEPSRDEAVFLGVEVLYDEWKAAMPKIRPAWTAVLNARAEYLRFEKDPRIATPKVDKARAAVADAEDAHAKAERDAARALRKFDEAFIAARRESGQRFAVEAVKAHEAVEAAWQEFQKALAAREQAYNAAGSPAAYLHYREQMTNSFGEERRAREIYEQVVSDFPAEVVAAVAAGEDHPLAEIRTQEQYTARAREEAHSIAAQIKIRNGAHR